jgi:hypothetical protein
VASSCGCTTAALRKKTYAVGERDSIKVDFESGSRIGFQEKVVTLKTDDEAEPVVDLILKVNIPQLLEIEPRFVYWNRRSSEYSPVSICVKYNPELVRALSQIDYNPEQLVVESTRLADGEFQINLTPIVDSDTGTVNFRKSLVKLLPDVVEGIAQKSFYIYIFMKG